MLERYTECEVFPNCNNVAFAVCAGCHKPFCETHISELDKTLCQNCLSVSNTVIQVKPLIDSEGVHHKGKIVLLSGEEWKRNRDTISKMSDQELDAKLSAWDEAVKEAELQLERLRILRNIVHNEKDGRVSRRYGRIRLIAEADAMRKKLHPQPQPTNGPTIKAKSQQQQDPATLMKNFIQSLKGVKLTPDQIATVIEQMAKGKK